MLFFVVNSCTIAARRNIYVCVQTKHTILKHCGRCFSPLMREKSRAQMKHVYVPCNPSHVSSVMWQPSSHSLSLAALAGKVDGDSDILLSSRFVDDIFSLSHCPPEEGNSTLSLSICFLESAGETDADADSGDTNELLERLAACPSSHKSSSDLRLECEVFDCWCSCGAISANVSDMFAGIPASNELMLSEIFLQSACSECALYLYWKLWY